MFETALVRRGLTAGRRITYHTLVCAGLIALAVLLPQLVHLALGAPGGVQWLPMYLPVLIGGALLGTRWGLAVGILSPLVSFCLTSLMGSPMPAAARLPFMVIELAVFAVVSGLFTGRIAVHALWSFPAVILAQLTGRAVFLGTIALTQSMTDFTVPMIWGQIRTGFAGLAVQAVLAPLIVMALRRMLLQEAPHDRF